MSIKSKLLNRSILLVCLVSMLAFASESANRWATEALYAADTVTGQDVATDRASFYNVPTDHKLEIHLDYTDGRSEQIKYPSNSCAAGTVISRDLNLYTAKFVAQGCESTVFQNLNLRWMGECQFKLEQDPDMRIIARGPYGEVELLQGHQPAGLFQLLNLPANTTNLLATMAYTNVQGIVQTGNVEFVFHTPHPGCAPTPSATPTPSVTSTGPIETSTPTATTTATATLPSGTASPTATGVVSSTPTQSVTPSAPTETATPTMTGTAVVTAPPGTAVETPTAVEGVSSTPTPAKTPNPAPTISVPTGLDPSTEPSLSKLYLPLVTR